MTSAPSSRRKRDGTLKTALIDAGVEILRERGPDGLSLRECAAKAGVSHAAPGYHFKNLMGLSTAIAARGFRIFCLAMSDRLEEVENSPFSRLSAICHGYLDFASNHPHLFLFIFSGQKFNEDNSDFSNYSAQAYSILKDTCAPLIPNNTDPEEIEILVWSLVHGYAHLTMTRKKENPRLGRSWPDLDPLLSHLKGALLTSDAV